MPKLYMLTLEWYDGEWLEPNFPKYHVHTYPGLTQKQHDEILTDMELYSPYDYTDEEVFIDKKEFEDKLEYLKSKGVILND